MVAWPKYLRIWFFGIFRSHMSTSLCKRWLFQMTQHQSKSEQLEWEFWCTLWNSPHPILSTISHKKWYKDEFEAYQHTCNFSNKICPLHFHRHIKSGLKCFLGGVPLVVRLVAYQTSQNASNNRNDEANAHTSDKETCLSSESERNKSKLVRWSDHQIQVLRKMWRISKVLKSSKYQNIWFQMKENLNIQYLLFKYLVFFLIYASFKFGYTSFIFYFLLCVECDT